MPPALLSTIGPGGRRATWPSRNALARSLIVVAVGVVICAIATGCSFNVNVGKGADVGAYRAALLNALRHYGDANKAVDESTCAGDVMTPACQQAAGTFCDAVADLSSAAKETEPPAQFQDKHAELVQLMSGYVDTCTAVRDGFRAGDAEAVQSAISEISDWHVKLGAVMADLGVVAP